MTSDTQHKPNAPSSRDQAWIRLTEIAIKYGEALVSGDRRAVRAARLQIDALYREHQLG